MNNGTHQAVPNRFTEAKSTNLVREVFTSDFWMSGLAMLKYIPGSFRVKQVDGMAFFTESKRDEFRNRVLRTTPANPRQRGTMNVAQMLHHLNLASGSALGFYKLPDESYLVSRPLFRWILVDWFPEQPVQLVAALQTEYSLMNRDPAENGLLHTCEELGIGFVPWGPIGMGYLTQKLSTQTTFDAKSDLRSTFDRFQPESIVANKPFVDRITDLAKRKNATILSCPSHGCWPRSLSSFLSPERERSNTFRRTSNPPTLYWPQTTYENARVSAISMRTATEIPKPALASGKLNDPKRSEYQTGNDKTSNQR